MNIRSLNQYEKNLVLEALASLTEAEKKEVIKHIKSLRSLEAEAEAEAEALEAEAYNNYYNRIAEAEAEVKAETEALTNILINKAKAEASLLLKAKENTIQYDYNKALVKAEAKAEDYINSAIQYIYTEVDILTKASTIELINLINLEALADFLEVKASAEAKAFIYVSNNINILAEAEVKEAKAEVKAEVLEVLTSEAKAEVKALVLTSEAFNNIEAYNKSIISNYINFNNLVTKTKLYNKFEHKYINSIVSLNIMLFDNTYYVIIANDKVLKKLASLVTYKNLSYKDKRSLKAIKKASFKEAKTSASLEAEASYINDILEASINFNFNSRYFITEVKAEAEAKAEAKAEVKAYLKALAIDNYFKFLRLKDLTLITEAEAEAFLTEALASNNQYKLNTAVTEYYSTKEVFKNIKGSIKVNTLYGLVTKTSNRYSEAEALAEAKAEASVKVKAKTKALYSYQIKALIKAEAEAEAIAKASLIALLNNTSKEAEAEAEASALKLQKLNFYIGLKHYNYNVKEAITFKKAIDLI